MWSVEGLFEACGHQSKIGHICGVFSSSQVWVLKCGCYSSHADNRDALHQGQGLGRAVRKWAAGRGRVVLGRVSAGRATAARGLLAAEGSRNCWSG